MVDPNHKATFSFGVRCHCSCGWMSALHFGKGAKSEASKEWETHKEKCEDGKSAIFDN